VPGLSARICSCKALARKKQSAMAGRRTSQGVGSMSKSAEAAFEGRRSRMAARRLCPPPHPGHWSSAGHGRQPARGGHGPSAMRVAGLEARLEALGHQVVDGGNIRVEVAETRNSGDKSAATWQRLQRPAPARPRRWSKRWKKA